MITIEVLKEMTSHFEMIEAQRKLLENAPVIAILKLFGIPEHKSSDVKSIPDFLENDNIFILVPKSIFELIDFSSLRIPDKIKFQENIYEDSWQIVGVDNLKNESIGFKFDSGMEERFISINAFDWPQG